MPTNDEIISAVRGWQRGSAHPITCGTASTHRVLEPFIEDGVVILRCLDCGFQTHVPEVVIHEGMRLREHFDRWLATWRTQNVDRDPRRT